MIFLSRPVTGSCAKELLDACVKQLEQMVLRMDAAKAAQLQAIKQDLIDRWTLYIEHGGDPSAYGPSPYIIAAVTKRGTERKNPTRTSDGQFLYDCYASGNKNDDEIVAAATECNREACPYCGIRLRPKPNERAFDRDHVVPRSTYPEFSVLVLNLVSACDDCNDAKGSDLVDLQGDWIFVHPYFDQFLNQQLLVATIQIIPEEATPLVSFAAATGELEPADARRVERHLARLDVAKRAQEESLGSMLDLLWAQTAVGANTEQTRTAFEAVAQRRLARHPNDPIGVLAAAVANCEVLDDIVATFAVEAANARERAQSMRD